MHQIGPADRHKISLKPWAHVEEFNYTSSNINSWIIGRLEDETGKHLLSFSKVHIKETRARQLAEHQIVWRFCHPASVKPTQLSSPCHLKKKNKYRTFQNFCTNPDHKHISILIPPSNRWCIPRARNPLDDRPRIQPPNKWTLHYRAHSIFTWITKLTFLLEMWWTTIWISWTSSGNPNPKH